MRLVFLSLMVFISASLSAQFALYGTASLNGSRIELTQAINSSVGGGYDTVNVVNLKQSFTMRFFVNLGNKDGNGADGMSFIFRSVKSNLATFGSSGGGLSYENLTDPFIAVEFDTYYNSNRSDPTYDHVAIMTKTANHGISSNNLAGPVQALPNSGNIEDGVDHEIGVIWDAVNYEMKVYLDCYLRLTLKQNIINSIFLGDSLVYYGAIASTGGLNNLQVVEFNPSIKLLDTLEASCGDTSILVNFPNKPVSCASLSSDGTEFRLQDSTALTGTFFAGTYVGVNGAKAVNCNSKGLSNNIRVFLDKPLYKGYYVLRIKKGSDQTTLGPFCSNPDLKVFQLNDIPEFSYIVVKVGGKTDLKIVDSTNASIPNPGITVCLPKTNPFPYLQGISNGAVHWSWLYNNDTIAGQNVNYVWAQKEGNYKLFVKDQYNCSNLKQVEVIFDTVSEFYFAPSLYCDKYGEPLGMPNFLAAPIFNPPWNGKWEWYVKNLGLIHKGDTLDSSKLLIDTEYTLKFVKSPKVSGGVSCSSSYEFLYSRSNYPPQDPLFVSFTDSIIDLCADSRDTVPLRYWQDGLRMKFGPHSYTWYKDGDSISNTGDFIEVSENGIYTLMVKDSLGCWGVDSVEVALIQRSDSFQVYCDLTSPGNYHFRWEGLEDAVGYEISLDGGRTWRPSSGSDFHEVSSQTADIHALVRALMPNVCSYSYYSSSADCPESNIGIPNIITPNGDGLNDQFEIDGLSAFPGSSLKIVDRWGNVVYNSSNYKNDWSGKDLPEGVYFFTIDLSDSEKRTFKGSVTILR